MNVLSLRRNQRTKAEVMPVDNQKFHCDEGWELKGEICEKYTWSGNALFPVDWSKPIYTIIDGADCITENGVVPAKTHCFKSAKRSE